MMFWNSSGISSVINCVPGIKPSSFDKNRLYSRFPIYLSHLEGFPNLIDSRIQWQYSESRSICFHTLSVVQSVGCEAVAL